jgi:2,4-dienoyl-CoA reductase (NADPH2)
VTGKTVVVGGGAVGCETALHLSDNQCPVTIVEQLPKIGGDLEAITKKLLIRKLKENHVQILTKHKLSRIDNQGVYAEGSDGNELFVEAENVVVAVGSKPENSLYEPIKSLGIKIYKVGDCMEPRSAKAAIYEGARIGQII